MRTDSINAPIAAEVRADTESEAALIAQAKQVISSSSWKLGELASQWTAAWAKGRTDADFGAAIGMTGDQVYQRRRVYDRFRTQTDIYRNLSWSHFYAALTWEDAEDYLQWASVNQATVAEMKAWRETRTAQGFLPPAGGRGGDPFAWIDPDGHIDEQEEEGDEDPFGEGEEEGAGKDSGGTEAEGEEGGTEPDGTDSEEEQPPRRRRSGREEPEGEPDPKEAFHNHKARTVKTIEALMRAIDDFKNMANLPKHDAMIKALQKMLAEIKQVQ